MENTKSKRKVKESKGNKEQTRKHKSEEDDEQEFLEDEQEVKATKKKIKSSKVLETSRMRELNSIKVNSAGKCIVYWMCREQRVHDNWALLHAQSIFLIT